MPTLREIFSNIADATRSQTGSINLMHPEEMPDEIRSIDVSNQFITIQKGREVNSKIKIEIIVN